MAQLSSDLAIKLSALLASIAAFTVEDFATIKAAGIMGDVEADNIQKLQNLAINLDEQEIADENAARQEDNLPPV